LRYQLLLMQPGRASVDFNGHYELLLTGTARWSKLVAHPVAADKPLQFRQYARLEGRASSCPRASC
jgi:hypothetical protein